MFDVSTGATWNAAAAPGHLETAKERKSAADTYGALISTIAGVLGILVSLATLDIGRSWRLVALLFGVAGIGAALASLRLRHQRTLMLTGIALLAVAGAVLVLSPPATPVAAPASANMKLSDLEVTGGDTGPVSLDLTVQAPDLD